MLAYPAYAYQRQHHRGPDPERHYPTVVYDRGYSDFDRSGDEEDVPSWERRGHLAAPRHRSRPIRPRPVYSSYVSETAPEDRRYHDAPRPVHVRPLQEEYYEPRSRSARYEEFPQQTRGRTMSRGRQSSHHRIPYEVEDYEDSREEYVSEAEYDYIPRAHSRSRSRSRYGRSPSRSRQVQPQVVRIEPRTHRDEEPSYRHRSHVEFDDEPEVVILEAEEDPVLHRHPHSARSQSHTRHHRTPSSRSIEVDLSRLEGLFTSSTRVQEPSKLQQEQARVRALEERNRLLEQTLLEQERERDLQQRRQREQAALELQKKEREQQRAAAAAATRKRAASSEAPIGLENFLTALFGQGLSHSNAESAPTIQRPTLRPQAKPAPPLRESADPPSPQIVYFNPFQHLSQPQSAKGPSHPQAAAIPRHSEPSRAVATRVAPQQPPKKVQFAPTKTAAAPFAPAPVYTYALPASAQVEKPQATRPAPVARHDPGLTPQQRNASPDEIADIMEAMRRSKDPSFNHTPQPSVTASESTVRPSSLQREAAVPAPVATTSAAAVSAPPRPASPTHSDGSNASSVALHTIESLEERFVNLGYDFKFPTTLDFGASGEASDLLFTPNNAPLRSYEHSLTGLLTKLDAVDSAGDENVRESRRELVKRIEKRLDELEKEKIGVWKQQFATRAVEPVSAPTAPSETSPASVDDDSDAVVVDADALQGFQGAQDDAPTVATESNVDPASLDDIRPTPIAENHPVERQSAEEPIGYTIDAVTNDSTSAEVDDGSFDKSLETTSEFVNVEEAPVEAETSLRVSSAAVDAPKALEELPPTPIAVNEQVGADENAPERTESNGVVSVSLRTLAEAAALTADDSSAPVAPTPSYPPVSPATDDETPPPSIQETQKVEEDSNFIMI